MASLDQDALLALGTQPISDAAPCGEDIADDEEYMFVDNEMNKLDRIDLGAPDWYAISSACESILRSKCKDVEVATWYGLALFEHHRWAGLAGALSLIDNLLRTFWENLYPQRERRRKVRVEAFAERLVEAGLLAERKPSGDADFDAAAQALETIEAIKTTLTERMPDDPPDFNKFTRKLKDIVGQRPKQAGDAVPVEGGQSAAPSTTGSASSSGGAAGGFSAGDVQDVSGAVNAILGAAAFIRKSDPADPLPYAVNRFVKWARVELPTTDAGRFQVEPPEKTVVEALEHQHANGLWEHLLKGAEAAFRAGDPLWLDLQYYLAKAMEGMGRPYDKARQVIGELTVALAARLGAGLFDLTFRDGRPLCGGEARMWIESLMPKGSGQSSAAAGSNGKLQEANDAARQLAGSGKLGDAVKTLQDGLSTASQRRDRFLWRLRIAQLCFDAKRVQLAAPLLEECQEEIQRHHIDEWEPLLAVEVAQALYRCRKALLAGDKAADPAALQRVQQSYAWLCQLDPLAALSAEPGG